MPDTPFINGSISDSGRRMVRSPWPWRTAATGAAGSSGSASSAGGAGGSTCVSAPIRYSSFSLGNAAPRATASASSPIRSMIASTALTVAGSGLRLPARISDNTSSAAWLNFSKRGRLRKPQLPFTVWKKRKMASSRWLSPGLASQATTSPARASSVSCVSDMNS